MSEGLAVSDNRAMPLRVSTPVRVVALTLSAAALAAFFLSRTTTDSAEVTEREAAQAVGAHATLDTVLGCVGQVAPNEFSLAVSRVLPNDPLRIETYGMVGSGGLTLSDHVGHTIEVTGTFEDAGEAFPRLHLVSARYVAASCWKP